MKIALCVAKGLSHINSEGFVHRDLALRNIFLIQEPGSLDYLAIVGDIGWVALKDPETGQSHVTIKTLPWRITAPEAFGIGGPCVWSDASDVWSYVKH